MPYSWERLQLFENIASRVWKIKKLTWRRSLIRMKTFFKNKKWISPKYFLTKVNKNIFLGYFIILKKYRLVRPFKRYTRAKAFPKKFSKSSFKVSSFLKKKKMFRKKKTIFIQNLILLIIIIFKCIYFIIHNVG